MRGLVLDEMVQTKIHGYFVPRPFKKTSRSTHGWDQRGTKRVWARINVCSPSGLFGKIG